MKTFVLIHGGMLDGNSWNLVSSSLEIQGCRVFTPTLTGLGKLSNKANSTIGLETHVQDIISMINHQQLSEVILVGHSYGGMVASGVADKIPDKIKQVVYVAAVLAKDGESMFDAIGPDISHSIKEKAYLFNGWQVPPSQPDECGIILYEHKLLFEKCSSPHPLKCFQDKLYINGDNKDSLQKIFVSCSGDEALRHMIERARNQTMPCYQLDSGHFPMITASEDLVNLLMRIT